MDDGSRVLIGIIGCLITLFFTGFLSACETAVVEINDSKLNKRSENDKSAKRLKKLVSKPNQLMVSTSVSKTLMTITFSVFAETGFFIYLSKALLSAFGDLEKASTLYDLTLVLSFAIIIILSTILVATFGIILPKKFVVKREGFAESFAYKIGGIYGFFLWLFSPIALISTGLVNLVLKLFRIDSSGARDSVTEEEILMMVDAVNETGGIEESQKEMINNIFEFDDLEVKDVMTHRTSLLAVELNDPILDAVKIATEDGFSRIPVYNETIDNICGVLFAKDLLKLAYAGNEKEYKISDIMREIKYVPESNYCSELFKEFTLNKNQIAVVVDEYGGTAGIVSMEDLIEAIVGNIQDEYDNEEEEIQEITPNTFDLLGTTGFDDAMDEMGIDYPEDNDYDTIGGFVIDLLGRYPEKDESPTVKYKNVVFTVIKSEDKKIQKLRALKINKENAQNTEI